MNDIHRFSYSTVTDLIDLDRYPVHDLSSEVGQTLIANCQRQFRETGVCSLPGFVKSEAIATLAGEIEPLVPNAFYNVQRHNVYFKADDTSLPEDHPARHKVRTAQHTIAYDQITPTAGIYQIYNWTQLREFIEIVVGKKRIYLHADPLAALNVMVMKEGDELGWHYDRAGCATTLLLQRPEAGGAFEFVSNLRSEGNENYEGVAQLLSGVHPGIVSRAGQAGTLTLFAGYYSPHRVTPVQGKIPRMVAVLGYVNEPDVVFSESARIRFYGRAG
jgi:hypothetical protein